MTRANHSDTEPATDAIANEPTLIERAVIERQFEGIRQRWHRRVAAYLRAIPCDSDDRIDIEQSIWCAAWLTLENDPSTIGDEWTWLLALAKSARSPWDRDRRKASRCCSRDPDAVPAWSTPVDVNWTEERIEAWLEHSIASMPNRMREVARHRLILDKNVADTAAALRVCTGTVKAQLYAARERLKKTWNNACPQ